MQNRSHALATGAFVLLLTVAVVAAAVWLTGDHASRASYLLVSHEPVTGLSEQSAVFYRGVRVGTVESVHLDPRDFRDILVRVSIDRDVPITRGTYGTLQAEGITGLNAIELDDPGRNPVRLRTSEKAPGRIPLGPSFLETLTHSGRTLIDRLSKLAVDLDGFASPANRTRVRGILAETQTMMRQMDSALATVPELSRDTRRTLSRVNSLTKSLQSLSGSLNTLSHGATRFVRTGTAAGQELRGTTLPRLDRLLKQLSTETLALQQLSASLQQDPQMLLYGHQDSAPGPGEAGYRK